MGVLSPHAIGFVTLDNHRVAGIICHGNSIAPAITLRRLELSHECVDEIIGPKV